MKKNNLVKTFMRIFAVLASVGGVLFLFRDKILSCTIVQRFLDSKEDCPLCSKLRSYQETSDLMAEEVDPDEEAFEHAFDTDPTTAREYVSLNINPHRPVDSETTTTE